MGAKEGDRHSAFTLVEMSIVLVIIGLIVGGVLAGQGLISAAAVRAQITQIEKYNTAANTFREKYGYLPGDIPDPAASSFGFVARGTLPGQGDGDGVLNAWDYNNLVATGTMDGSGENGMFWVDLSTAHLIDGTFNTLTPTSFGGVVNSGFERYFPTAKMGQGNFVYTFSSSSINYFGISVISQIKSNAVLTSSQGITVKDAQAIDAKVDDGLAQQGRVTARYVTYYPTTGNLMWAAAAGSEGANSYHNPTTAATPGDVTTCYDNSIAAGGAPGVAGAAQHYSIEISGGTNVNCALSFRMQSGD